MLVGTNAMWIYYESQWETVETTIEAEQRSNTGSNFAVGGDLIGVPEGKNNN